MKINKPILNHISHQDINKSSKNTIMRSLKKYIYVLLTLPFLFSCMQENPNGLADSSPTARSNKRELSMKLKEGSYEISVALFDDKNKEPSSLNGLFLKQAVLEVIEDSLFLHITTKPFFGADYDELNVNELITKNIQSTLISNGQVLKTFKFSLGTELPQSTQLNLRFSSSNYSTTEVETISEPIEVNLRILRGSLKEYNENAYSKLKSQVDLAVSLARAENEFYRLTPEQKEKMKSVISKLIGDKKMKTTIFFGETPDKTDSDENLTVYTISMVNFQSIEIKSNFFINDNIYITSIFRARMRFKPDDPSNEFIMFETPNRSIYINTEKKTQEFISYQNSIARGIFSIPNNEFSLIITGLVQEISLVAQAENF